MGHWEGHGGGVAHERTAGVVITAGAVRLVGGQNELE